MMREPLNPLWQDPVLNRELSSFLHESNEICIVTITMISEKLRALEQMLDCSMLAKQPQSASSTNLSKREKLGRKLNFTYSESKLEDNLARLKDLNESFRIITDQLSKAKSRSPSNLGSIPRQQRQDIERFRLVQKAAAFLYDALVTACTRHDEHDIHLCLQPSLSDGSNPQIRFSISFSPAHPSATDEETMAGDPMWLAVESTIRQSLIAVPPRPDDAPDDALSRLTQSLHLAESTSTTDKDTSRGRKVTVRFETPTSPQQSTPCIQMPTVCLKPNFCNHIRQCPRHSATCLGLLEETPHYKHLVYPSSTSTEGTQKSTSLEELFTTLSRRQKGSGLPEYEKLRFGKLLATAVLQFHTTSWLKGSWQSQDVLFFNSDTQKTKEEPESLTSPYMNVSVRQPDSPLSRPSNFPSRIFAPNPLLFGLGVILLELAFEAPLRNLQKSTDLEGCQDHRHTEFFTAKRLSHSVSPPLGLRYNELVRKCLQCDFGRGEDLKRPELQEAFYRDVVCVLGDLENKVREVHLGM
jgi:hypothetical protein